MNKIRLVILLLVAFDVASQKDTEEKSLYKEFTKEYKYTKDKKFLGPNKSFAQPQSMEEAEVEGGVLNDELKYSPEQIQRSRGGMKGWSQEKGGSESESNQPSVQKSSPFEVNPPRVAQDIDAPDNGTSTSFWKVILIIVGSLLLLWIIYLIVKNYKPKQKPISSNFSPDEWNPAIIPKTELELRLEQAIANENYREGVRIYFTFILKELIRLRKIKWNKELTNFHYLIQLSGKEYYSEFEKSVKVYDLVWYGDYSIDRHSYDVIIPTLHHFHQTLIARHE